MKLKIAFAVALLTCVISVLMAQGKISGTISDDDVGETMPFASVQVFYDTVVYAMNAAESISSVVNK